MSDKKQVDQKIAESLGINYDPNEESTASKAHGNKEIVKDDKEKSPEVYEESRQDRDNKAMEADFIHVRNNTKRLIERGEEMFEDIYRIAQETDNARSFEVAGNILKEMIDANQKLLDMHEKKQKIRKEVSGQQGQLSGSSVNSNNTTNVFAGTTADLLKIINGESETKKVVNEAEDQK